ncbi:hypothetical protein BAY60_22855 [Prauserella muralis]|uniref:Uncharacterized protein n=1 Tax=Prauserella muralis TaxID=588067 RepID=A0A2V4APY5_9PSEU|nr:hypothetical protein BAY60_22855 [Prauserella muralis]TWE28372.1 hypothetical protein FHX69_1027 [Prauserella muralis]
MPRAAVGLLAAGALAALGGCADAQAEKSAGTIGTNVEAGDIELRNVVVEPPDDGRAYRPGEDAVVRFSLFNDGERRHTLVRVEANQARTATLHWDRFCDGTAERVSRLPVPAGGAVPGSARDPADGATYYATMENITNTIRPGTTTGLVFVFADAGRVPADALVYATERPALPGLGCEPY